MPTPTDPSKRATSDPYDSLDILHGEAQPIRDSDLSSTDSSRFAAGTVLGDRYRIVSRIGRGGIGEVYRADDLALGTSVALKFLHDSFLTDRTKLDRFRSEARLTREITHPNVCRVYDLGEINGSAGHHVFFSMEYVDGDDLSTLLRRIGRLTDEKAIQIAHQVCSGLQAAHELGVVHRDLKPSNIILDGRGNARIMDFGVAGVISDLVAKGDIASGSPMYMAPEQLARKGISKQSDIYSLGLVLYELFTGHPAFLAESIQQLSALRNSGARPISPREYVPTLAASIEKTIFWCLELDPELRPSSAIAVSAALVGDKKSTSTDSTKTKTGQIVDRVVSPSVAGSRAARERVVSEEPKDDEAAKRAEKIRNLLGQSPPEDYAALEKQLLELSDAARSEIATRLQPALNEQATQMPQHTYEEKKELAKWVNEELRRFGHLAIECPKTGRPAYLLAHPSGRPGLGRFYLELMNSGRPPIRTISFASIPPFKLMVAEVTPEQEINERDHGR